MATLHDRWLDLRDRLLRSPVFQRRAAAFALTRPTARRHARELFDLVAGFVYSQVLLACVRLDLFQRLADGPRSLPELAAALQLPLAGAQRLLDAACALELAQRRSDGRIGLGRLGAPLVGNEALLGMIAHHDALYADLADPVALLRGDREASHNHLARYWPYAVAGEPQALADDEVAPYSALMSASQPLVADEILDAHDVARHRCLLDVGGGEGRFVLRAAQRAPALRLMVFDLPAVAARAQARLQAAGLAQRAQAHGGDFTRDALPAGADLITLVRVVHDHDDARVLDLLRRAHAALPASGALLIAEPMADTPGARAMGDAYFGMYLLAMGRGQARTPRRLSEMLAACGFEGMRLLPTRQPLQTQVLLARRAG